MQLIPYAGLVRRLGPLDFTKIAAERSLNRLTGGAVSRFFFARAMSRGAVYFGEHLGARQGVRSRRRSMYRLACHELEKVDGRPFRVLEAGSYAGGSAITWALAVQTRADIPGEVVCVDPWRNYLTEADIEASATPEVLKDMAQALESDAVYRLFEHNIRAAGVDRVVRTVRERFAEAATALPAGSCDIVYLDANHTYTAVVRDLQGGARLLRPGGVLCGDDLEAQWPTVDQAFCEARAQSDWIVDPRTRAFVHPGVSKAVWDFFGQEVSSWNGFWAMRLAPDGSWRRIERSLDDLPRVQLPAYLSGW